MAAEADHILICKQTADILIDRRHTMVQPHLQLLPCLVRPQRLQSSSSTYLSSKMASTDKMQPLSFKRFFVKCDLTCSGVATMVFGLRLPVLFEFTALFDKAELLVGDC